VAALLNLDEGAVTEEQLNEMNRGMSLSDAQERYLQLKITEFGVLKLIIILLKITLRVFQKQLLLKYSMD